MITSLQLHNRMCVCGIEHLGGRDRAQLWHVTAITADRSSWTLNRTVKDDNTCWVWANWRIKWVESTETRNNLSTQLVPPPSHQGRDLPYWWVGWVWQYDILRSKPKVWPSAPTIVGQPAEGWFDYNAISTIESCRQCQWLLSVSASHTQSNALDCFKLV